MRALLAVVLVAGTPAAHHTVAATKAAQSSLLRLADLGKGWTAAGATSQRGVRFSCPGHSPNAKGIVETGAATSPAFSPGSPSQIVQQNTSVYASTAEANAWWNRAVTPSLVTCVAETFSALAAKGVKVKLLSTGKLAISTVLPHTAGYRVLVTANAKKLYFDVIVLGSGETITAVSISSFLQPVPAAYEQALAKLVARKLGGPSA
jgi:hypothetical protein